MVLIKTKSIAQLKREIAEQRKKIAKEELASKRTAETIKLQRQLFELKNRKLLAIGEKAKALSIAAGQKAKRLSGRFGRGLLKAGKKAAPIIKKQAELIRKQQLRDDAIERKLAKGKTSTKKQTITTFVPVGKGKKKVFKKIKVKVKVPTTKTKKKKSEGMSLFQPFDF